MLRQARGENSTILSDQKHFRLCRPGFFAYIQTSNARARSENVTYSISNEVCIFEKTANTILKHFQGSKSD